MNFIEELRWRGLIHEMMPETEAYLNAHQVSGYLGVDPTGDSMHIGNLVPVMMLVHLQRAGHKPVALVGGATGMVGDPSGKDKERQLLSMEQIQHNVAGIRKQLEYFLDFDCGDNSAELVNNYDWFGQMGFLEFLRDVGKHITISYMMGKESVRKRMNSDAGISYTEFAYQLLQGYDFFHLYKEKNVQLQVGGSDQWGNITTGTELIRRMTEGESHAFGVVCPLMTREDGSKFGKTADGQSVWLSAEKTSPFEFYQYWLNVGDQDAEKYIKIFTLKPQEEIEGLITTHREDPGQRTLHKALAEDITLRVHGEAGLAAALKLTAFLFSKNTSPQELQALTVNEWRDVARNSSDTLRISREKLQTGMGIMDFLTELGITQSKSEARRAIEKDNSIRINAERITASDATVDLSQAMHQRYLQVQKGKKKRYVVEVE